MNKTKIFEICKILTTSEFIDFEVYLTHYTKAGNKCIRLYLFLLEGYKASNYNWDKANIDKDIIKKELYKNQKSESTFRMLRSELLKYLEGYCAFLQFQSEKKSHFPYLLRFLAERNNEQYFRKIFTKKKEYIAKLEGLEVLNTEYELWSTSMDIEFIGSLEKNQTNFESLYNSFTNYSLIKRMQQYCILLNRVLINEEEISESIVAEIEGTKEYRGVIELAIEKENIKLIANAYKFCIQMLKNKVDKYYELKNLLEENKDKIDKEDQRKIFNFMYTFCIYQIRNNQSKNSQIVNEFQTEVIKTYFYRYENGLLEVGLFISVMDVKNVCNYAILRTRMDGEMNMNQEDAYKTIMAIHNKVKPEKKHNSRNHNLGNYYFYIKDYDKAIAILRKQKLTDYPNPYLRFDEQTVLLRSFYESKKDTKLENGMNAFKLALNNDKLIALGKKEAYYNFILAMRKLYLIQQNRVEEKRIQPALKELSKLLAKPIKVPHWFKEKIKELKLVLPED